MGDFTQIVFIPVNRFTENHGGAVIKEDDGSHRIADDGWLQDHGYPVELVEANNKRFYSVGCKGVVRHLDMSDEDTRVEKVKEIVEKNLMLLYPQVAGGSQVYFDVPNLASSTPLKKVDLLVELGAASALFGHPSLATAVGKKGKAKTKANPTAFDAI